ncbi:MAG: cyclomaltodextrinase [Ruminococcaceae bacterium]|nr:cyclomaltodextrinase [Oscillospiraceae bacterium]
MWAKNSVFYQIYPLGFCGAPKDNDGVLVPRIRKVMEWIPHLKRLNADAVYFSPVFESDRHGYDTRDYKKIDCRLGDNEDFAEVCRALKENGIRVVLDGVFNHVGRGFWAFQDVLLHREQSEYRDWFHINFNGNSCYNDGMWYEGWEGHFELVKLNLENPKVSEYLFSCIKGWMDEFQIDGLRIDVAYCLNESFLRKLRQFCDSVKQDFFLVGEVLFGDYKRIVNSEMLHSCTNYECYKSLYSAFNDMNLFEISHSLNRQFGKEEYAIYKNEHLLSFADNHDVTRVASILKDQNHLPLLYGILFTMPGIPCIYYGSEWGISGVKEKNSDDALRPEVYLPEWNDLTTLIATLADLRKRYKALLYGDYKSIVLTNRQLVFQREFEEERIWVAVNADNREYHAQFNGIETSNATNLLTGESVSLHDGSLLSPYSLFIWKID